MILTMIIKEIEISLIINYYIYIYFLVYLKRINIAHYI